MGYVTWTKRERADTLINVIWAGGMANVYRCTDTIDDREVAIKILKDEYLNNDEFIRRFKNESKAIAMLSHPNIVKVYDVSFGDMIQYIVMEYIDGITLKEYIDRQGIIEWKDAIHLATQILKALQHAHECGIVHRDIKPQNIMLLQDGTIKVTDFGIARFSDKSTRTMTIDGENIVSQNNDDSEFLPTYSVDENGNKHYAYRGFETLVLGEHVHKFYAAANADNYPNLRTVDMSRSAVSELTGALCSSAVTSLILPHNLKTIDEGALFELNIERIDIPSTVESIGNEAFMSSGLKSVTFGESEIAFGDNVFAECAALETVDLSKVTFAKTEKNEAGTVPAGMFKNCTSLSAININNAKAVGDNAFNGCSALSEVIRDKDAKISIGNSAFSQTMATNSM